MPRAELYAIVVAVENVDPEEELTIISDSEINIKLYHKGKGATRNAANYDLWCRLWKAKENRKADLHIKWTKAHGKAEHLDQGLITHEDLVGNAAADALAGLAADRAQVSLNDSAAVLWCKSITGKVQGRVVKILLGLDRRDKHTKTVRTLQPVPVAAAAWQSPHRLHVFGAQGRFWCQK